MSPLLINPINRAHVAWALLLSLVAVSCGQVLVARRDGPLGEKLIFRMVGMHSSGASDRVRGEGVSSRLARPAVHVEVSIVRQRDIVDDLVSARVLAKVASLIVAERAPAPARLSLSKRLVAPLVSLADFRPEGTLESQSRAGHPAIMVRRIGRLWRLVEVLTSIGHL